jgi:hypothetical protein
VFSYRAGIFFRTRDAPNPISTVTGVIAIQTIGQEILNSRTILVQNVACYFKALVIWNKEIHNVDLVGIVCVYKEPELLDLFRVTLSFNSGRESMSTQSTNVISKALKLVLIGSSTSFWFFPIRTLPNAVCSLLF